MAKIQYGVKPDIFKYTRHVNDGSPGDQAHLRSLSGPGSRAVLHGSPTGPEFQVDPDRSQVRVWRPEHQLPSGQPMSGPPSEHSEAMIRLS